MNVKEARAKLKHLPQDATFAICAHGFKGLAGQAWAATHFDVVETSDGTFVLVEGATDGTVNDEQPVESGEQT